MSWLLFSILICVIVALDLWIYKRKGQSVCLKDNIFWSLVWVGISLLFNLFVYFYHGPTEALQFFTGYLLEKSLSVDNLFVFALIFSYFKVPKPYEHKVLYYGIIGALVMRFILIFSGVALVAKFPWLLYLFGAFLAYTGIKFAVEKEKEIDPEKNLLIKWCKKIFPVTNQFSGAKFFVRENGVLAATPLFIVVLLIESSDLIFALDSIPAIFAITTDPFIVYTSNIFAILGLRSLYFILVAFLNKFSGLKVGLGIILAFIGLKMIIQPFYEIPLLVTLLVIVCILGLSTLKRRKAK